MIKKLYIKIFLVLCFFNFSYADSNIALGATMPTLSGNFPETSKFLLTLAANINWMVGAGLIIALGMTIIHLFMNHNENILKALLKTFAGLIVLKAASFLITKVVPVG